MSLAGNVECLGVHVIGKRWANGQPVLGKIDFSLAVGEVIAISGPSGCGKSTLMRIIAGQDKSYEGIVSWQGGARLGIVFQTPRLLPWRTALQNIALALPGGSAEILQKARAALDQVGLSDALDSYPARMSLGMARRVALARALAIQPDVLLLDEAFVSLDDETAQRLRAVVLEAVAQRRMSVLMVSHDLREAVEMADRTLRLGGTPARVMP